MNSQETESDRRFTVGVSPLYIHINKLENALKVLTRTQHIREYLEDTDPQALNQALDALGEAPIEIKFDSVIYKNRMSIR